MRGREALAGYLGAAMTGIFPLHRAGSNAGLAPYKQHTGIPCHPPFGIQPSILATTGFNGIKTDSGIPFNT